VASGEIDLVLFDLGGVLIELGGVAPMRELAGIDSDDELWRRWLTCRWVRSFERGECSADDFATGVINDWGLAVEAEAFLDVFRSWPIGPLAGADALVQRVRDSVPVGCLSNTNVLHWDDHFTEWPIFEAFDYRFLSFELGIVKPDRALFDRVAEMLPSAPERVLFLDDNVINVEGARAAGFVSYVARGVDEATDALISAGVLRKNGVRAQSETT
jgi:HAD superfamily hydrolase (TIGR01509 family)